MKYQEFKKRVEALGYLVSFEPDEIVKVMNRSGNGWLTIMATSLIGLLLMI